MLNDKLLKAILKGLFEGINLFDDNEEEEEIVFKKSSVKSVAKNSANFIALTTIAKCINMRKAVAKEFQDYDIFQNVLKGCNSMQTTLGGDSMYKDMRILLVNKGSLDSLDFKLTWGSLLAQDTWQGYKFKKMVNISQYNYLGQVAAKVHGFITENMSLITVRDQITNVFVSLSGHMCAIQFASDNIYFMITPCAGNAYDDCLDDNAFVEDKKEPINKLLRKAKINVKNMVEKYGFMPKYGNNGLFYESYATNSNKAMYSHLLEFKQKFIDNNENLISNGIVALNDDIIIEMINEPYEDISGLYNNGIRISLK